MILGRLDKSSFLQGIGAGAALAGVALLVVGAVRRARRETAAAAERDKSRIDGVHPPETVELAARPQEEANARRTRLESEGPDAAFAGQRW